MEPALNSPAVGRLAPTPSGHLHLGNALAFGAAWLSVRARGGRLLLRVEDLDRGRARDEVAEGQRDDLRWLGLDWDEEVAPQSTRTYTTEQLPTYRCLCTRATRLYLGCRCRYKEHDRGNIRFATPPGPVDFVDRAWGPQRFTPTEDPILVRADGEPAYPLAVVVDDLRDGVTEVVRGGDLLEATATQILLYGCLGRRTPSWTHVPVLHGEDGRKLGKSHGSTELRALRTSGWSAADVWRTILPALGMPDGRLDPAAYAPERFVRAPRVVDAGGRLLDVEESRRRLTVPAT